MPALGEHRRHFAEYLLERRRLAVEVDEPERAPGSRGGSRPARGRRRLRAPPTGAPTAVLRPARTSRRGRRTGASSGLPASSTTTEPRCRQTLTNARSAPSSSLTTTTGTRPAQPGTTLCSPRTPTYCQLRRKIASSSRSSTAGSRYQLHGVVASVTPAGLVALRRLEERHEVAVVVGDCELTEAPRLLLERGVRVDDLLGLALLVELVDSADTDADHRVRLLGRDPARPPEVDPGLAASDDSVLVLSVEDREAEAIPVPGRALPRYPAPG